MTSTVLVATASTDIYSLGALTYEMLAGERPRIPATVRDDARSYRAVCSASLISYCAAAAVNRRSSVSQFGTTTRLVPADAD